MFRFTTIAFIFLISLQAKAQNKTISMDSLSYSVGILMGQNLKQQGFDGLDANSLADAIKDVLSGKELKVPEEEAQALVNNYASQKAAEKAKAARSSGNDFLSQNGSKDGITTTASGLQYEVLLAGQGRTPGPTDKVNVHYHGTLIDGTVFDSSVERGQPISFPVNGVIQGWQEALQLMKEGDKWRVYIPSDLAYGERGAGAQIPPHSALIFEVELISVE